MIRDAPGRGDPGTGQAGRSGFVIMT